MKTLLLKALGTAAILSLAPAAQAAVFTEADMQIAPGPNGTITASFGNAGIAEGLFTDTYTFTIPQSGAATGILSTSTLLLGSVTDLDFTEVLFNNVLLTPVINNVPNGTGGTAQFESVFAANVSIVGGVPNVISISGVSRGNGAYGAQGTFTPASAVPEPGTWAMMLLGFGAVGYSMRSRRRIARPQLA